MWLKDWAEMENESIADALAWANENSRKTSKMFDPRDLDRRSNRNTKVWYQAPHPITGFRRPRFIDRPNSSPRSVKRALSKSALSHANPQHGQANDATP